MEIKNRIETLMELKAELDERAQAVKEEILQTVEFADREELTQGFIDWYYWETNYSLVPLAKALGIHANQITGKVTPLADLALSCLNCGDNIIFSVTSKQKRIDLKQAHRSALRVFKKYGGELSHTDKFICPSCAEKLKEESRQRKQKANAKAAKIRVTKTGQGLDLENMPYQEYLQTDYWKKFAHNARKHAGYCCQQCGRNDTYLDVHHLTYERRGKEWYSDVLVLCRRCHAAIHGKAVR